MVRPLVYIAGPYSQGDQVLNVREALEFAEAVFDAGGLPYVPHLSMLWHAMLPHPYEHWLDVGLGWVEHCDALLRTSGESPGADREVDAAVALDIPVFYAIAEVKRWLMDQRDGG